MSDSKQARADLNRLLGPLVKEVATPECTHDDAEWCPNSPAQLQRFSYEAVAAEGDKDAIAVHRYAMCQAEAMVEELEGSLANQNPDTGEWTFEPELVAALDALITCRDASVAVARRIREIKAVRATDEQG